MLRAIAVFEEALFDRSGSRVQVLEACVCDSVRCHHPEEVLLFWAQHGDLDMAEVIGNLCGARVFDDHPAQPGAVAGGGGDGGPKTLASVLERGVREGIIEAGQAERLLAAAAAAS